MEVPNTVSQQKAEKNVTSTKSIYFKFPLQETSVNMPVFSYSRRLTVRSPSSACIGDKRFSLPHVLTLCRDADKEISRQRGWVVNLSLQHCPEMLLLFSGLHFLSSLQIFGCIATFLCSLFLGFFPVFESPVGLENALKTCSSPTPFHFTT